MLWFQVNRYLVLILLHLDHILYLYIVILPSQLSLRYNPINYHHFLLHLYLHLFIRFILSYKHFEVAFVKKKKKFFPTGVISINFLSLLMLDFLKQQAFNFYNSYLCSTWYNDSCMDHRWLLCCPFKESTFHFDFPAALGAPHHSLSWNSYAGYI